MVNKENEQLTININSYIFHSLPDFSADASKYTVPSASLINNEEQFVLNPYVIPQSELKNDESLDAILFPPTNGSENTTPFPLHPFEAVNPSASNDVVDEVELLFPTVKPIFHDDETQNEEQKFYL
jgi:hypothetical protein